MDNIYVTIKSNTMNQFNLNELRSDVGAHLADQYPGSYTLIHPDFQPLNVLDWDHLVDFVIAALIGDQAFMILWIDSPDPDGYEFRGFRSIS